MALSKTGRTYSVQPETLPGYPTPQGLAASLSNQALDQHANAGLRANAMDRIGPNSGNFQGRISISHGSDGSMVKSASMGMSQKQSALFSLQVSNGNMERQHTKTPLNDKGFSRSSSLSSIYGVVMVLLGLVAPMTEALRDTWMTSHLVAAFMTYLYSIGSIFVIYLYVHEAILKKKNRKKEELKYNDSAQRDDWFSQTEYERSFPKTEKQLFTNFQAVEEMVGNDNLGMEDEPVAGSSSENSSEDDISKNSDSTTKVESNEDKPKITFYENNIKSGSDGNHNLYLPRSESIFSEAGEQAPDEVFNYIATQMGTATQVSEGTSFFLKGGALVFAMANMVYVALRIEGEHRRHEQCESDSLIYPHYIHLLFIVMQTFFLLKNEFKFVLRYNKPLVRFGLVHMIATNLCVWLRFLMIEVVESLMHQQGDHHVAHSLANATDNATSCELDLLMFTAGPYLFPFVLEYSLVASSMAAFLFSSINIRVSKELYRSVAKFFRRKRLQNMNYQHSVAIDGSHGNDGQHHGPFSKSHTGLFIGVIMLAGVIVSMVMFFHWKNQGEYQKAELCFTSSETILLVALFIPSIMGLARFFKFVYDVNESNTLDHALLLISGAFYLVLELFELVSTGHRLTQTVDAVLVFSLLVCIFSIIQSLCQTMFIIDGMQRVAVKEEEQREQYGRGVVMFLIVVNVAFWVFKSFQEKRSDMSNELNYYGDVAWTIIISVALPLVLFYRFHSSICLAHMWHHCYEKHDDHIVEQKLLL